jgi:hypothetical protein
MSNTPDIKYLNKDFTSFKSDLLEYAKAYFPTSYNDFSQASPGSMFIEMASYVGDVLSFYLDNQLQETFLQYAKQKNNLFTIAYMLGYRPKITSAALVNLDVYQTIPAKTSGGSTIPDFDYALIIAPGMNIQSNVNGNINFYVPTKVDFTTSSSLDPTDVSVYNLAGTAAGSYLLKKTVQAVSGQTKTQTFSFGAAKRFQSITINDANIISIINVVDSSGNIWYEVPYLAQDYIDNPVKNTVANYPSLYQQANQVPYILEKVKIDRRFTTRFKSNESMVIEFGSGINSVSDSAIIPNPSTVNLGVTTGPTTINTAFDPTNFVTTTTYGLAPYNTSLTVTYLVGGGSQYNVLSNQLTIPSRVVVSGFNTSFSNTIATNNPDAASGGGDGDSVEELRLNSLAAFMSQLRAVTQQDYLEKALSMPSKYGKISKAYVTKDDATFAEYQTRDLANKDQLLVSMYVLALDVEGKLSRPSNALMTNLKTYLAEYRMLTDSVNIKPAYIINIGCDFDIITRPNFNPQDVIARCLIQAKDFFNIDNFQINEPIILNDLYILLDKVEGVQTVKDVRISNKSGGNYSQYAYDISAATMNKVIYPSLDPSVFEVKYLDTDIQGRVVTF